MNQYHENNEYGSYPVDVCIPLFHNKLMYCKSVSWYT
ncbi:Uncharacterised protein [Segatella copri]|jgi:hypothetical protein|nr:Uncharacterised protein [Segatella copri]